MSKIHPTVDNLLIIASCSDGKCRQVVVCRKTAAIIASVIKAMEAPVKILEDPIEGIVVEQTEYWR